MPYGEDGRIPEEVRQRLNALVAGVNLPDGLAESPRAPIRGVESELTCDQRIADLKRSEFLRDWDPHDKNIGRSPLLDLLASSDEAKAIRRGMKR